MIEIKKVSEIPDTFEGGDIIFALAKWKISREWQQIKPLARKGLSKIQNLSFGEIPRQFWNFTGALPFSLSASADFGSSCDFQNLP